MTLYTSSDLSNTISEEMLIEYAIPPMLMDMAKTVYIDDKTPVDIEVFKTVHALKMKQQKG